MEHMWKSGQSSDQFSDSTLGPREQIQAINHAYSLNYHTSFIFIFLTWFFFFFKDGVSLYHPGLPQTANPLATLK